MLGELGVLDNVLFIDFWNLFEIDAPGWIETSCKKFFLLVLELNKCFVVQCPYSVSTCDQLRV
jgi:hypothetical protein